MTEALGAAEGTLPWTRRAVIGATGAVGFAGLLLGVAWFGASDSTKVATQMGWLNVGVVGILVVGVVTAAMTLTGRKAVGIRRQRLLPDLAERPDSPPGPAEASDGIVAVPRMRRYHRASCPLVAGKAGREAAVDDHRRAGLEACGICRPDQLGAEPRP